MTMYKLLPAISVATVVALAATAVQAVPVVGAPRNGPATLNQNPGPGNFDVTIATHDGSQSYAGNGTWTLPAGTCAAMGNPAGCGTNQEIPILNSHWVGNNGSGNPAPFPGAPNDFDSRFSVNGFWVSFADTGVDGVGPSESEYNDPVNIAPEGKYTYTFSFTTGDTMAHLGLWIYADDTADVYIKGGDIAEGAHGFDDGVNDGRQQLSFDAHPEDLDEHCADPSEQVQIGCQAGEQTFVEMFWLSPNTEYTIEVDVYQSEALRAFGLQIAGGLVNVPEPGTLALLGLGVMGLGAVRYRRRKAA